MYNKIQNQISEILRIVKKDCTSQEWHNRYLPELEILLAIRDKIKQPDDLYNNFDPDLPTFLGGPEK